MDSPREVAEQLVIGITERRFDEVSKLYAEDCVVEVPYAFGATAARLEGGQTVREHFARAGQVPFVLRARGLVVHETEDPELVVSEWDYEVTARATGRTATVANVQFLRVRDGQIVHSKDFHDHRALAELAAPAQ
jgi:ketosteroid isomerase-like protein